MCMLHKYIVHTMNHDFRNSKVHAITNFDLVLKVIVELDLVDFVFINEWKVNEEFQ